MKSSIKRVLIYRLGSLGDTVVALPALHLVARAYPEADRWLLTNFPVQVKAPPAAAILEGTGLVHGYFRYTVGTRSPLALLALWWQLVLWRPEVLVYMGPPRGVDAARRDARFFRLCGIRQLMGVPLTEEMQENLVAADGMLEQEAARLTRNLAELGNARLEDSASWDLQLTSLERARADEALRPVGERRFLAVSIGTKVQTNDWGRENWRVLLAGIARRFPGYVLAITGSAIDTEYSEAIAEGWREGAAASGGGPVGTVCPVVNLCGVLTPRESAAVFARASLFLGHDSGPMHLAAAVQTPCVAIFSARGKPRVWFPHGSEHRVLYHPVNCWGCGLETCIVERKKCILSITVEEVLTQVCAVLGEAAVR